MVGRLLERGMLCAIAASLVAFCFAKIVGEPQIAQAIAFESAQAAAHGEPAEQELVSRSVQSSWGLLVAMIMCGAAYGGIFSIVFAFAYQRFNHLTPRALSLLIGGIGFTALVFIPDLKYPPNPPAVGLEETIGYRTTMYFVMLALSICTVMISTLSARYFQRKYGTWNATIGGVALGCVLISLLVYFMPTINEVPQGFPAAVLWNFREDAIGTQLILWSVMSVLFASCAQNLLAPSTPREY